MNRLMKQMTAAGFNSVFVGIETPDDESLTECGKTQNHHRNLLDSVKKLHQAGLQVMGGFIVGFDSDTPTIFKRQVEFIQKSGIVTAMVGLLQAPYGTQLYKRMEEEGRLTNEMTGDNVDGTTNIVPKMDFNLLKDGYLEILDQIYSPRMFYERVKTFLESYVPRRKRLCCTFEEIYRLLSARYSSWASAEKSVNTTGACSSGLIHLPREIPAGHHHVDLRTSLHESPRTARTCVISLPSQGGAQVRKTLRR